MQLWDTYDIWSGFKGYKIDAPRQIKKRYMWICRMKHAQCHNQLMYDSFKIGIIVDLAIYDTTLAQDLYGTTPMLQYVDLMDRCTTKL